MAETVTCPVCGGKGVVDATSRLEDDQSLADRDQTASNHDQTWSDRDQTSSEHDERSAAADQEAADRDLEAGGDPVVYEQSRRARERARADRDSAARLRAESADERLLTGEVRDLTAGQRDRAAAEHARLTRPSTEGTSATLDEILVRAEEARASAAADRARAAEDRARAAADRAAAAEERAAALLAETEARRELLSAWTDELTGAWTRRVGLANIGRELERAHRTNGDLIMVFVDIDGLKEVNDTFGHAEGDRLIRLVVDTLRASVRPYDLIVRYGGDEFLCAMPQLTKEAAIERLDRVAAQLSAVDPRHSIGFGLADYEPGETLDGLIARADADLLARRGRRAE